MENNTRIAVGLDIGTTKITVIVGLKNEHGKIEILGMGKAPSTGVMRGIVANIDKTTQSINKALEEAITSSSNLFNTYRCYFLGLYRWRNHYPKSLYWHCYNFRGNSLD